MNNKVLLYCVVVVQTMVRLPKIGIFKLRTDVDACDSTRGLYGHRKHTAVDACDCTRGLYGHRKHTAVDACDCTRGLYGHRKTVCTGS